MSIKPFDSIHKIKALMAQYPRSWAGYIKKNNKLLAFLQPKMDEFNLSVQGAVYCLLNDTTPLCQYSNTKKFTWYANGFSYCGTRSKCQCNNEKSTAKAKKTNTSRYGDPIFTKSIRYKEKNKQTCLARYGVPHVSNSPAIRNKAKETCLELYGTEYPSKLPKFTKKSKQTRLARYGDENYNNRAKAKETCLELYGVVNHAHKHMAAETLSVLSDNTEFRKFMSDKTKALAAYQLGVDANTILKYISLYPDIAYLTTASKWELIIQQELGELGIKYKVNTRKIIPPLELDFYLPEYKIAIEINGNYWHSEIGGNKDKHYHHNKWLRCREQGIDLYSYFEDEFIDNINIITDKLRYLTNDCTNVVGARKMQISNVSASDEREFLNKYHIQGSSTARNKTIGAYFNGNLVAVFSWLKRKQYLEITRYACDSKASYPGLFSKMMSAMIKELSYTGKIVSFSNNGHSNGGVYNASGFTIDKILPGAYWYMINYSKRENRQKFMKNKIKQRFNIDMNEKTEWQAMQSLGYDRIWDSGKIKWSKIV